MSTKSSKRKSFKYISSNPKILGGAPVIAGTRMPISRIIFLLKEGYTTELISSETKIEEKKIKGAVGEVEKDYASPIY